jgi:iron complex outermembrane recepter protein
MKLGDLFWITVIGTLTCPVTTFAQEAQAVEATPDNTLQAVVVTANRRQQEEQDVGISVSAYSGEQLQELGVTTSTDIARLTPGVFVSSSYGGEDTQYSIRGVTQNDFGDTAEGPIAVYVDDDYIPTLQGQGFGLFDISRVEILKGPQGTLFGRNATGGLVQFVINKPTPDLEGFADVTYGAFNQTRVEAAVSDTIVGSLEGRASFYYNSNDPIYKNIYPAGIPAPILDSFGPPLSPCCQDQNDDDTMGGRLQLLLLATDRLSMRFAGSYMRQNLSTNGSYTSAATIAQVNAAGVETNSYFVGPNETRASIGPGGANYTAFPGSPLGRLPGADWFGFIPPSIEDLNVSDDFALRHGNTVRATDASLHIDYDFGFMQFTAITDYSNLNKDFDLDLAQTAVNFAAFADAGNTHSLSQEARLSGNTGAFTWTAGLYYLQIDTHSITGILAPTNSLFADSLELGPTGADLLDDVEQHKKSYSVYGQGEYRFAPRWTAILGARAISEKQEFNFISNAYEDVNNYTADTGVVLFPLLPSYDNSRTENMWAGKTQIEFRPGEHVLMYLGVNRGTKGGGYNVQVPDGTPALGRGQIPYEPENLLATEFGVKTTLAGGKVQLNGDVFHYDYRDYQAFTFQFIDGVVQNRDAKTNGGEVSVDALLLPGLQFQGSAAVTAATVENVQVSTGIFRDVEPAYAPKHQASGRLMYTMPWSIGGGHVSLLGDMSYQSYFYDNIRNFDGERLPGYWLANARLSWEDDADRWSLAAYVNNVADKRYATGGFDLATTCGCSEISYGNPRWWGVTAHYKF